MTLEELLEKIKALDLPGEFFIEAGELIWMFTEPGACDEDLLWGMYVMTIDAIDSLVSEGQFEATEPLYTPKSVGFRIKKR